MVFLNYIDLPNINTNLNEHDEKTVGIIQYEILNFCIPY